eukprot:10392322-Alexandrium_andersonii.AAC.1
MAQAGRALDAAMRCASTASIDSETSVARPVGAPLAGLGSPRSTGSRSMAGAGRGLLPILSPWSLATAAPSVPSSS